MFEELPPRLSVELHVTLKEKLVLSVPLFRGLELNTLFAIIMELKHQLVLPGEVLFRQGEEGDSLFLVYRGRLGVLFPGHGF